jgi:radical S-adenosyl methionine domain-containing protein 2
MYNDENRIDTTPKRLRLISNPTHGVETREDGARQDASEHGSAIIPPSVNYHLWEPCNMRCRYCFATFKDVVAEILPRGHLPRDESLRLVEMLAPYFKKLTFAGGEPMLCSWLADLIKMAKSLGMTTMLVTNGSRLSPGWITSLRGDLDWITLSVDSASEATHRELGRALSGQPLTERRYLDLAQHVRASGMRLKINTVVTSINAGEDMTELIESLHPERWKILRVLPIAGQNTGKVEPLICGDSDFFGFIERHRALEAAGITLVPEDNDDVRGSYAMVDPAGRFFDDMEGRHRYSEPIAEVGVEQAFSQVSFSMDRFNKRGGSYNF